MCWKKISSVSSGHYGLSHDFGTFGNHFPVGEKCKNAKIKEVSDAFEVECLEVFSLIFLSLGIKGLTFVAKFSHEIFLTNLVVKVCFKIWSWNFVVKFSHEIWSRIFFAKLVMKFCCKILSRIFVVTFLWNFYVKQSWNFIVKFGLEIFLKFNH